MSPVYGGNGYAMGNSGLRFWFRRRSDVERMTRLELALYFLLACGNAI